MGREGSDAAELHTLLDYVRLLGDNGTLLCVYPS